MAYPFPGMNPWLEHRDVWHDVHHGLMNRLREALAGAIRPRYSARVDENVYIQQDTDDRTYLGRPDVAVVTGDPLSSMATGPATETLEAPAEGILLPTKEPLREPFLEIRDNQTNEIVAVIELLSPTNKRSGSDRDQYEAKRRVLLQSTTHFIEIDLLRGGVRSEITGLPNCDYYVMVSRYEDRPRVGLWPIRLKERLPVIPIPLAGDDPSVPLDLQTLLEAQFEAAGYEDYIYRQTPQPPLHSEDAAWAEDLMN
jgi:hypothetical protein